MPEVFVTASRDSLADILTRVQAVQPRNLGSNLYRGEKWEEEAAGA